MSAGDENAVEQRARALYERHYSGKPNTGWEREPRWLRDEFTQQARAALEAVLGHE